MRPEGCYKYFAAAGSGYNFDAVEQACRAEGGHLASLHSAEEAAFAQRLCAPGDDRGGVACRVGLRYDEGEWTWSDHTAVDYWATSDGEPVGPPGNPSSPKCLVLAAQLHSEVGLQEWVDGTQGETCGNANRKVGFICKITGQCVWPPPRRRHSRTYRRLAARRFMPRPCFCCRRKSLVRWRGQAELR